MGIFPFSLSDILELVCLLQIDVTCGLTIDLLELRGTNEWIPGRSY
jgi:hypothetical protein